MKAPETTFETTGNIIEMMISQLGELPAAPVILAKALKLTSNIDSNIREISKSVAADQTLTAKVIRLSNSPFYGRVQRISSLSEAISVMGFNQVKSVIMTASTSQMFQSGSQTKIARILWEHSFATALGARLIASKYGGADNEEAYLCGLLHDIGKLVMLQSASDSYERIIAEVKESNSPFHKVERRVLGYNHVQVGKALLTKWRFPHALVSQISGHHSTNPSKPEATVNLKRVVAIADSIAKYIGAGFFEAYMPEKESVCFIGDRLIEPEDLISLRVDTEEHFNYEVNSYFD
jgi:putative nucleotidyltransferase with HDIG domain